MGAAFRHWRRAKIGRRFRLFFRFDSKNRIIVFAWANDENTLRSSGSRSDPYTVFQRMLEWGHPPCSAASAATKSLSASLTARKASSRAAPRSGRKG